MLEICCYMRISARALIPEAEMQSVANARSRSCQSQWLQLKGKSKDEAEFPLQQLWNVGFRQPMLNIYVHIYIFFLDEMRSRNVNELRAIFTKPHTYLLSLTNSHYWITLHFVVAKSAVDF